MSNVRDVRHDGHRTRGMVLRSPIYAGRHMSEFKSVSRTVTLCSLVVAIGIIFIVTAALASVALLFIVSILAWKAGLGDIPHSDYYVLLVAILYVLNLCALCYFDYRLRFTHRVLKTFQRGEQDEKEQDQPPN
jgi:hypothetical protein